MHLTGFNQAHTPGPYQGFLPEEGANFSKVNLFLIFWMWAFCKNSGVFFFFTSEGANLTKEDPSLNFEPFLCPKIHKIPNFSDFFARKQQFGGLFCRLGNLGGAMHHCTPPSNGHAFNMYNWWYHIVHVQQTLNYTNLTTAPKCKKPNLNLCMCVGVGVWVLLKSPFCVKHPIFTNTSWDFDDLSTKTRHAPYNPGGGGTRLWLGRGCAARTSGL